MGKGILGIHHVTAIAGDPQENLNFYVGFLGLRLVKLTVNFDDPETYHLYFGDGEGRPGSILTFFPWPGAMRGRHGTGQATVVSLSIPKTAIGFWIDRFRAKALTVDGPAERFGAEVLSFRDPDGLRLEFIATDDPREPWTAGAVPAEFAIRGIHGVTLSEEGFERTAALLARTLGFRAAGQKGNRYRYEAGSGGAGAAIDVECLPDLPPGRIAVGTVHHIAWRTHTDAEQAAWRDDIAGKGYNVTPIIDRRYFRSIYFREPGGVLFEIATDPPGFTVDEPESELGTQLVLPPWLEPRRKDLELRLPPLRLPQRVRGA